MSCLQDDARHAEYPRFIRCFLVLPSLEGIPMTILEGFRFWPASDRNGRGRSVQSRDPESNGHAAEQRTRAPLLKLSHAH